MRAVPAGDQSMAGCRKGRIMVKSMTSFGRTEFKMTGIKDAGRDEGGESPLSGFQHQLPERLNLFESRIRNIIKGICGARQVGYLCFL